MNMIEIQGTDIELKEYMGKRVVTFRDIDRVHNRPDGTASRNFKANRKRFISGVDYFQVKPSDFQGDEIRPTGINNNGLTLITETGYLMLVKSFTDDLAWRVQRDLVEVYFRRKVRRFPGEEVERTVTITQTMPENPDVFLEAARIMSSVPDSKPYVVNCLRHVVSDIDVDVEPDRPKPVKTEISVSEKRTPFLRQGVPCDVTKLKKEMKKRNLSMQELAAKAGISMSTMRNTLECIHRPMIETRNKLCAALGEDENFLSVD